MNIWIRNVVFHGVNVDIKVENGVIAGIIPTGDALSGQIIDMGGRKVFPGLIDIHSHGNSGFDTMEGHLSEMSMYEARHGITSWLPTTMTMPFEEIRAAVSVDISSVEGANVLGFHAEGPYIASKYKGAQREADILLPDAEAFGQLPNVKMVTLAPEVAGGIDFIRSCHAIVCLGHTDTDYETAMAAFAAGASCVTHTMNAMPPLHHRKPALLGAAFDAISYVQVICDGIHIHPTVIRMLYRLFGPERMILISDSMRATGMPDGKYLFGGQEIIVADRQARLADGTLAGSTTNLFACVQKAIEFGIPEEDAYKMASETPAALLSLEGRKGVIAAGADADLIFIEKDGGLCASMIGGKMIPAAL